jgi:hypothetical protein
MLDAVILRPAAFALALTVLAEWSDDIMRPAELRQRRLDGSARRFLRLEKDEFMLVRDDHDAGAAKQGRRRKPQKT